MGTCQITVETTDSPTGGESVEPQHNFTPRAQQVLALARKEADRFHHNFVGTEHLLLGLISLGQGVAVNVLQKMGVDLETVRVDVEKQIGTGPDQKMFGNLPYTPRVKKVLLLAAGEAKALNHSYVGTEHVLLGLLREGDGVASRVLQNLEVDIEQTRQEILKELDPNLSVTAQGAEPSPSYAAAMSARPAMPQNAESPRPQRESIDTSKRYDVYCTERDREVVVYRNALFKSTKALFPRNRHDTLSQFVELEQADGQTIFVALYSVIKFCEHGTTPGPEAVSGQKP
jgi:ATP-dependent Clp protease ATP-binding subunit ClpA